jgi:hypothetical protein
MSKRIDINNLVNCIYIVRVDSYFFMCKKFDLVAIYNFTSPKIYMHILMVPCNSDILRNN